MIIDDNTSIRSLISGGLNPQNHGRGYRGMWESDEAKGLAGSFGDIGVPLIPESDLDDHIRQIELDHATIPELCDEFRSPVKNQQSTNYCWINAPTRCAEIIRLRETGEVVSYSPASAGGPIKSFRNVGGWGSQGLRYMRESGINESTDWPDNAISRRYYTDENRAKALANVVLEYYVIETWQEMCSCIVAGIPTANGYSWWSHEVTGVQLKLKSHDLVIDNSWGTGWGDRGRGVLSGRRKIPGDCVAITAMMPV